MRHRYGSNKLLLSKGQSDWGLRCTFLLRLLRQKVKPNLHSIRERASWCEDAGCSSGEPKQKPLDIPHHCTELKIPYILSSACLAVNENVRLFSKACVKEGDDDENLGGQRQVPASWLNLHVLMIECRMAPHHRQNPPLLRPACLWYSAVFCWHAATEPLN